MHIRLYQDSDRHQWNEYVSNHPQASCYHLIGWKDVIERAFSHATPYLLACSPRGEIKGVLPLVLIKSSLFGTYMVSLPFFNYGGVLADDEETERELIENAISLGQKTHSKYIELRHFYNKDLHLRVKSSKVSMILPLPENAELLFSRFKSKLRSQIRKPEKEGLKAVIGGEELLSDFYEVFSRNMRDLGTPVYDKRFFATILKTFPETTRICTVYYRSIPVASGFLLSFKDTMEMPWASSLRNYNHLSANMLLYWNALKHAADNGFQQFDFGRSTPYGGTYRFKEQWGSHPVPLYWHYWLPDGSPLPELNPNNPRYKVAIALWKHLPLCITNRVGPRIVKNIA